MQNKPGLNTSLSPNPNQSQCHKSDQWDGAAGKEESVAKGNSERQSRRKATVSEARKRQKDRSRIANPKSREGRVKGSGYQVEQEAKPMPEGVRNQQQSTRLKVADIGQNRKRNQCLKGCETNSGAANAMVVEGEGKQWEEVQAVKTQKQGGVKIAK
jgi:hypothetical protein